MSSEPLISVILPCFKMGSFVGEALKSIGEQSHGDWEVLAVDDCGPADGTREAVEKFASQHPEKRVEFIQLAENRGVSGARNAGAAVAKGEFLTFLDPDDLWRENHLRYHLREHQSSESSIISTSRAEYFFDNDPSVVSGEWGYSDWEKAIFPRSLALRNVIVPSTVLLPAEQFREVGGFDEDRSLQHTEDWDLWVRLTKLGIEFRFLEQFTVLYRRHEGGATADRLKMSKRVEAFSKKHHEKLFSDMGLAMWRLSTRVDGLESRLNWLQKNPIVRMVSFFHRIIGRGKNDGRKPHSHI